MTEPRPFEYPASGRVRTGSLYRAGGTGESEVARPAVVVVHGFFADRKLREIDRVSRRLSERFDVIAIDLRGHGDAPGWFTWGKEEHRDLADLVAFLRCLHPAVGVLGFSIGGYIAILSAALARERADGARPDAVCTVGAPAHLDLWRFRLRLFGCLRHLRMILARRRRLVRPGWPRLRWKRAVDVAAGVSPVPLLLIHGDQDWLVHPSHARMLYEAAAPPRDLLMLPGGLHAEYLIAQDPDLVAKPAREFFERTLAPGRPPFAAEASLRRDRS